MHPLAKLDHRYLWHPFTQMRDWLKHEPVLIVGGQGARLRDAYGREYLDANSSIWTNLHGHNHPQINAAIRRQLNKIAHSSALGFANEPASLLGEELVAAAPSPLRKVFYSDDGSTAMEAALKLAYEYARRTGRSRKPRFLALNGAYHGDTIGAVSLGHVDLFHKAYAGLLFKTDKVMAPYCYRCPFNRARPDRADARDYRKCSWECLDVLERRFTAQKRCGNPYAGFVFEPLIQGAAGMIPQPAGWLRRAAEIARGHGALLIADEVMTGFGRTSPRVGGEHSREFGRPGKSVRTKPLTLPLFACQQEGVRPDFMAVAKGLTSGYLPMAATLTTQEVFDAFLGEYEDFKTFFHGHSFTANQLGAAAALASLEILHTTISLLARWRLAKTLRDELKTLWRYPHVGDIRQVGLIVGIELVRDWRTREPFDLRDRAGIRVCEAMARHGVLSRPIGNVIVLMPPYCTTPAEACRMVAVAGQAIAHPA
ncbi:MAG TPA: aminotransferase class III-fold pyridoxal phosphate-dependent enzyme [Candidatus Paceibacterota bacterium]|nr:aminotransferase class III-fold pyridoxal phosphate-dependent enzyme [Verrucomicrobiota bacterium]HSA08837.1 aminotransferase class III-fold pyridoxal phosphate-dependent enzyme [Candidatus Paceibacterota bacterium]